MIEEVNTDVARRGRPRSSKYLPYEEAREFIRGEMIPSRSKYQQWWDENQPKTVPRFPYRVYDKEWTSWNDFLGTSNKFNDKIGVKFRTLAEATPFVHRLSLKSKAQWLEWCKMDGNLPADIPARPDLVYENWTSWNHWLGNKVVASVQARQEAAKLQVYYIMRHPDTPMNVLTFGIEQNLPAMKERWETSGGEIVKLFWYDSSKAKTIKDIVEALSTSYLGEDRTRIVPNVWEIVYHLQMHLNLVTPADVKSVN